MPAPYRSPSPTDEEPVREPAADADLGPLRSSHDQQTATFPRIASLVLLAAMLGALALLWDENRAVGGVFVLMGIVGVVFAWVRRSHRVELHANGLVVTRGAERSAVRFDDVDEVWYELHVNDSSIVGRVATVVALRLVERSGRAVRVPLEVVGAQEIFQRIDRACSFPLVADANAALDAGEALRFGKVTLTSTTVDVGGKSVAWSDLKLVRMQVDQIALLKSQTVLPWATISFDSVPHPDLFVRLVRRLAPAIEEDAGFRFGATR